MTFEILSTPVNSPASLIFQQCLAEVDPENRSLNSAMNEVGGYFLDKVETSPLSKDLWNKVLDQSNNKNSVTDEAWKKTQHISRRCYLTDDAPGSVSSKPTSGMISKLEDFDYTMEQSEKGYENFTVIKCNIKSIEWLYLAAKGHRRAKFDLETNKNDWLVP